MLDPKTTKIVKMMKNYCWRRQNWLTAGAGDGFHNAEGIAKVIPLENGDSILRPEAFKSTNAPNVHVYLSADKTISEYVDLGRLKANNGNQNYNIPNGTNLPTIHLLAGILTGARILPSQNLTLFLPIGVC